MQYILPIIISFILSLGITYLVKFFAVKNSWAIAKPRERDIHKKPIPRVGGISIFITFWLIIGFYLIFNKDKIHFVDYTVIGVDQNFPH